MKKLLFILIVLIILLYLAIQNIGTVHDVEQSEQLSEFNFPTATPPSQAIPVESHNRPWSIVNPNQYTTMVVSATESTLYGLVYDDRSPEVWYFITNQKSTQHRFAIVHVVIDGKVEISCLPEDKQRSLVVDCIGAVNESGDQVWGLTIPGSAVELFKRDKPLTLVFEHANGSTSAVVLSTKDLGKHIDLVESNKQKQQPKTQLELMLV